jgi:hypothetical protein
VENTILQVEAEKKKIIEEWVAIEKHQKEYEYKRQRYYHVPELLQLCRQNQ